MIAATVKIDRRVIEAAYAIVDTWIEAGDIPPNMRDTATSILVELTVQVWAKIRKECEGATND